MSFCLVAVLAVTANFLADYGGWIVTIQEQTPPAMPAQKPAASTNAATSPADALTSVLSSTELLAAMDRFERLARWRAETDSAEAELEWYASQVNLRKVVAKYSGEARRASPRLPRALTEALNNYERAGQMLVAAADERREALLLFSQAFELVNSRVDDALDGAWKIFGRVVARKSLVSLSDGLNDLRRHAAGLTHETLDDSVRTNLRNSEAAVVTLIDANARAFGKTYGDQWVNDLRGGLEQMAGARETIERFSLERPETLGRLQRAKAAFGSIVPERLTLPSLEPRPAAPVNGSLADWTTLSRPLARQAQAPVLPGSASILLMADEWSFGATDLNASRRIFANRVEPGAEIDSEGSRRRALVGWLSTGILAISILLTGWTIRSVTKPVRRLVVAARQLALGARPAPIAHARLKEFDTLTDAFNRMSEEIINARQNAMLYQHQLESKVEERTRQLQYLAERDPLTALPNRRQFFVLLNAALEVARSNQRHVGVMFVDIDNFKNINDGMGHTFGDQILIAIGDRLSRAAQPFGFAARLGGDEFTVIHSGAQHSNDIHEAGRSIVDAFQKPLLLDGRELHISVSVGISVFPEHAQDPHGLLQSADAALYRAKARGRNQASIFTAELLKLAADKFATEQGLRRAIDAGQFELVFQPEINVGSLRTEVVEALIRWRMPDGQSVPPDEFLAVAEESGLISEIGEWVMRSAIAAASKWHHGLWPQVKVAINVSPRQLNDPLFVEKLVAILREHQLPHHCIEIELTETALQTCRGTIDTLRQLQSHGVATTLDDFGTGYSSFSSLEQLPLSRVKLDRSLIQCIHTNQRSLAIVRAILTLCQGLGLAVTAEGIERPEQFALLADFSGMCLQGYLFSKPVSEPELLATIEKTFAAAQELVLQAPQVQRHPHRKIPTESRRATRSNVVKLV